MMNSRERVFAAMRFEKPDRVPRFIWLGGEVIKRLSAGYGITPFELNKKIGNDILQTWVSINGEMERDIPQEAEFTDGFGITWKRYGAYNMVVHHPMQGLSAEEIRAYPLPDPRAPERYRYLEYLVETYNDEYFIGADVSGVLFEPAYHLRNMEDLMMDLAEENEEIKLILDKLMDFSITVSLECIKRGADWIWMGDDLGSQQGMLMSAAMWRKFFKSRMKKIIEEIKKMKPGIPIAYHSCGSISPVIGDLVEIGINVLNPIQESAAGMDQIAVKSEYNSNLTLMCGLDTQQFMLNASPEEINLKTREKVLHLGSKGGYIFAVSHNLQGDVSDEKIEAMPEGLN